MWQGRPLPTGDRVPETRRQVPMTHISLLSGVRENCTTVCLCLWIQCPGLFPAILASVLKIRGRWLGLWVTELEALSSRDPLPGEQGITSLPWLTAHSSLSLGRDAFSLHLYPVIFRESFQAFIRSSILPGCAQGVGDPAVKKTDDISALMESSLWGNCRDYCRWRHPSTATQMQLVPCELYLLQPVGEHTSDSWATRHIFKQTCTYRLSDVLC